MHYSPVATTDTIPIDAPSPFRERVNSSFAWLGQKCRRFSRLAGQTCLLALDIIFFTGKVTNKLPAVITKSSLTLLSGVSFIYFPYSIDYTLKSCRDVSFALSAKNDVVAVIAGVKVLELLSTIGLSLANFSGAMEGLYGNENLQTTIYKWMTPVALGSLVLSLGTLSAYMYMNYRSLSTLTPQGIQNLAQPVIAACVHKDLEGIVPDKHLASQIRLCMDKDTLGHFLDRVGKANIQNSHLCQRIMRIVKFNIATQQNRNLGPQLLLFIAGEATLIGGKILYKPNSLPAASVQLFNSILYTGKILWETLNEVEQRRNITDETENAEDIEMEDFSTRTTS